MGTDRARMCFTTSASGLSCCNIILAFHALSVYVYPSCTFIPRCMHARG